MTEFENKPKPFPPGPAPAEPGQEPGPAPAEPERQLPPADKILPGEPSEPAPGRWRPPDEPEHQEPGQPEPVPALEGVPADKIADVLSKGSPAEVIAAALTAGGRPVEPKRRLPKRRPAELSAFVTAAAALAAYFGVDQAEGILYAGLGVAATLPFAVSYVVDVWRSVLGRL